MPLEAHRPVLGGARRDGDGIQLPVASPVQMRWSCHANEVRPQPANIARTRSHSCCPCESLGSRRS
eukprot:2291073-Lingulodinium_polyedra.AAC.1